jgi:hypothetical protein
MAEEEEVAREATSAESEQSPAPKRETTPAERRARQLGGLLVAHRESVRSVAAQFPFRRDVKWKNLTLTERKNHAEFRKQVKMANRAYHLAVRRACAAHRAEDGSDARPLRAPRARHPSRELA